MINERIALIMLEGEIPAGNSPDPHRTKQLYKSMQTFADASLGLCASGRTKKFEEYLKVALKLFKEGNTTVKNAIVNVYLFTVSRGIDQEPELISYVKRLFPKELMEEYHRFHYASGM